MERNREGWTASAAAADGRRLQAVLEAMPVAVSLASLGDGRIQFMNRGLTQALGYRLGDFADIAAWIAGAYPNAAQRERAGMAWSALVRDPPGETVEIEQVEVDIRCRNGTVITALHGGVIVPDAGWAIATFVDISRNKRDEISARQLAEQDALTGLRNRRAFDSALETAIREARVSHLSMHLILLDLDHFKAVNDRFGHHIGDLLLQEAAERIVACIRSSDPVARFGGDEFGIILAGTSSRLRVGMICDSLITALSQPYRIADAHMRVGASIGVARFPENGADPIGLFEAADRALYQAKRQGRGLWLFAEEGCGASG